MAIEVIERLDSRRLVASRDGAQSSLDLVVTATGSSSETAIKQAIDAWSPAVTGNGPPFFYKQSIAVSCVGEEVWEGVVHYDTTVPSVLVAEESLEFDTTGGTQHVTQAIATNGIYPPSAPNFQGAIGVSDSGVEGVDIVVPNHTFALTRQFAEVSVAYQQVLADLTGKINALPFKGYDAGEVLFLGAQGKRESNTQFPWTLSYRFAVQRNRANFAVGGIVVSLKYGWDYMWIRYRWDTDDLAGRLVQVPDAVYVEQVYDAIDLAALGV
ncbi:MAG: hypothetical protein KDE27_25595 [Planctomycetes bacterium]|nr:hypothetical protein [Planctomycetota bacterium]